MVFYFKKMFWGVTIDGGKRYSQMVERSFHVSMAALEPASAKEPISVMIRHENSEFLLCSLNSRTILQQYLDLNFTEGEEVSFFLSGSGIVHLTGFLLDDEEEDDDEFTPVEESDDDSESSDEDAPELIPASQSKFKDIKRKLEGNFNTSKTRKKKAKLFDEDEDDDDDDENEDDDDDEHHFDYEAIEGSEEEDSDEEEEDSEDDLSEEEEEMTPVLSKKKIKQEQKKIPKEQNKSPKNQNKKIKEEKTTHVKEEKKTPKGEKKTPKGEEKKTPKGEEKKTPKGEKKTPKEEKKTPAMKLSFGDNMAVMETPSSEKSEDLTESKKKKRKKKKNKNKEVGTPENGTPKEKTTPMKRVVAGGTVIEERKVGHGPEAKPGKMVHVYYSGKLTSGKQFDSCSSGKPFSFKLGRSEVIKGWDNGVSGMKVGGKRLITVPPQQGYGSQRQGPIPANSTLVFEVELKAVS